MTSTKTYFCVAHGGAAATCPPGHTMEALRKAVAMGAAMLYVEVRTTRDAEMVAWPSQQRLVADNPTHLADHTLAEWRRITENDPAPVASLDEVLALVAQTRIGITVDVRAQGIENALARKLRKFGIPYESLLVAIASESGRTVMRSMDPRMPLAHRFSMDHHAQITPDLVKKLDTEAVIWPPQVMTSDLTRSLKSAGIAAYAGLVNLAADMRRLRDECGVDGIVTPYPDLLLTLFDKSHIDRMPRAA